ncbi:MAG: TauD/TfdA dioxygenase family protein [Gammaproteobacteria bacterium]
MSYKIITVRPLTGSIGAEIGNIDLREPLSAAARDEIRKALLEHLVIFFRDQDIEPDQHKGFGREFGELHIHPYIPTLDGHPEIIHLASSDDGPGEMSYQANIWHTDLTYMKEPSMASILRGVRIPPAGGDTMFINLYAAFDNLSETMQAMVQSLTAVHDIVVSMPADFMQQSWAPQQLERLQKTTPPVEHPVVSTHPETGRKCLYVNRNFTSHIKGLSRHESDGMLEMLYQHIEQPEFMCRFRWEKNSIAFWDNRCTQHYAVNDYHSKREMHRVTLCGESAH